MASPYENVPTAPMPAARNYLRPGHYLLRLRAVRYGQSQIGKGPFTAAEFSVLRVLGERRGTTGEIVAPNGPGETVSHVLMHAQPSTAGNLHELFAALLDVPAEDLTADDCDEVVDGEGDSLAGTLVVAEATEILTRRGTPFTQIRYSTPAVAGVDVSGATGGAR